MKPQVRNFVITAENIAVIKIYCYFALKEQLLLILKIYVLLILELLSKKVFRLNKTFIIFYMV